MTPNPVQDGSPPSKFDSYLTEAFWEERVKQANRVDDLGKELLKIELAIPGLFATALKLMGSTSTGSPSLLAIAFTFWAAALALTLGGLFPREHRVQPEVPSSIAEFYEKSARTKWHFQIAAVSSFFVGVILAAFSVFST